MQKTCANDWCNTSFEVTDEDLAFYDRLSPVFNGVKHDLPAPNLCPDCRQQARIALVNEKNIVLDTCDLCDKTVLSQFSPESDKPVYCRECWHSDKWEQTDSGRDPDFTKPMFPQFTALKMAAPDQSVSQLSTMVNSDYTHMVGSLKNCYLLAHADMCEDCLYGYGYKKNTSCFDGFYNLHSELCYDCIDTHKCYGLVGCQDCLNSRSSAFLRDCIGCQDCFLCVGLREKKYCIRNEQLSKEHYQKEMQNIDLCSYSQYTKYKDELRTLEKSHTFKEYQGHNLENCSGDHLVNCKNVHDSYDIEDGENLKFCYQLVLGARNCHDMNQYGTNIQESYQCCIVGEDSYHLLFSVEGHVSSNDLLYCMYMERCKNCFGCAGMHSRQYCIMNKQYSKEEYEELVPKIIEHMKSTGEWGELFDTKHSWVGYNKTTAYMYFPLTKEETLARGWQWDDYEPPPPETTKIIDAAQLPDSSKDAPDDVLNWAIRCEVTGKLFKIQSLELKLYRQIGLPIPRRSPHQRDMDRFALRNPRKLFDRPCGKCQKAIQTTYSPDRPETVYCEECYLSEVY